MEHIQASEAEAQALHMDIGEGGDGLEELQDPAELTNKALDRFAETLARFKSDPKAFKSPDAKHVSSAMMMVYNEDERFKIICSKNEGLDAEDKAFLAKWKICMEAIAKSGKVIQLVVSAA